MDDPAKKVTGQLGEYATTGRREERSMDEIVSDMVANARRFGPARDEYWVLVLRSLQDKVSTDERAQLLIKNAKFPAFDSNTE